MICVLMGRQFRIIYLERTTIMVYIWPMPVVLAIYGIYMHIYIESLSRLGQYFSIIEQKLYTFTAGCCCLLCIRVSAAWAKWKLAVIESVFDIRMCSLCWRKITKDVWNARPPFDMYKKNFLTKKLFFCVFKSI